MEPLVVGLGSFGSADAGGEPRAAAPARGASATEPARRALRAAQAEVEDTDIEQMIEARNDIRRRRGLPEIGDDLVARSTTTDRR